MKIERCPFRSGSRALGEFSEDFPLEEQGCSPPYAFAAELCPSPQHNLAGVSERSGLQGSVFFLSETYAEAGRGRGGGVATGNSGSAAALRCEIDKKPGGRIISKHVDKGNEAISLIKTLTESSSGADP